VARAERFVAEAARGPTELDLRPKMMRLTLEVVAESLFGADLGDAADRIGEALELAIGSFERLIYTWRRLVPASWPIGVRRALAEASGSLSRVVDELVAQRIARGLGDDLLSRLLESKDEAGQPMDAVQLRDEAVTILLAGHETTAMALTFAFWALDRHREVRARLLAELDAVLGDRSIELADLERLPYATAVVKETLRAYPPVWIFGREATVALDLGPYRIEAGDQLLMSPWVLHHDPAWFPEPQAFRPERWLEGLEERLPKHVYFPFGGGQRVCVGLHFAMMEAVILLATIVRGLEVAVAPDYAMTLDPALTLRPRDGLPVRLAPRRAGTR
jgi:cytochrome P450